MTVSEDDDAKFALTEYAVMGRRGRNSPGSRRGRLPAARIRSAFIWPAWARPSWAISNMAARMRKGKGAIADKLHLHARSIDIARPDGGRLQVTAPLPPHMLKSWELLGFDPDDRRDPFPRQEEKKMKRFYKTVTVDATPGGFRLLLDGKPVQTPARQALLLPTRALAEAVAEEWRSRVKR